MPVAAITRLRIRSLRFFPLFIVSAFRSLSQARRADGCIAADMRANSARVFWTRSLWRDTAAMRGFMGHGVHRAAMAKLPHWCDEAAVVEWEQEALPAWQEAEARMRDRGRVSQVRHPSPAHARGETVPGA